LPIDPVTTPAGDPEPPKVEPTPPDWTEHPPAVAVGDRADGRYEADETQVVRARFTAPAPAPPEPLAYTGVHAPSQGVEDIAAAMHEASVWDARPLSKGR
jgi:hypothetical protein